MGCCVSGGDSRGGTIEDLSLTANNKEKKSIEQQMAEIQEIKTKTEQNQSKGGNVLPLES